MRKALLVIPSIVLVFFIVPSLFAGGIGITEKGVKGLGNAYATGAAAAEDASTIYWNPAGMTRLNKNELDVAIFLISTSLDFRKESATTLLGTPIPGSEGGDAGFLHYVPNLFYSHNFNSKWSAGLSVVSPFGLGSEYESDWVGRYYAIKSDLFTIDINPAVAYRINNRWAIGGGISAQYIDTELTQAIDFGTLDNLSGGTGTLTPANPASDGFSELTGDDWSYGYNFGLLYEPTKKTRMGLSYRSSISHDLKGDANFTYPTSDPVTNAIAIGIANTIGLVNTGGKASIDLPASASLSGFHMLNEKWAIMGDLTWTQWSDIEELRIVFDNGAPDSVDTLKWDDTWRFSAGITWYYNDTWTWRTGVAFDQSPVPNAELRNPRVPDEDRIWLALGGSWKFAKKWSLDFSGAYIWATDDPTLNKVTDLTDPTNENNTRGNLKGSYDAGTIVAGCQINFTF